MFFHVYESCLVLTPLTLLFPQIEKRKLKTGTQMKGAVVKEFDVIGNVCCSSKLKISFSEKSGCYYGNQRHLHHEKGILFSKV